MNVVVRQPKFTRGKVPHILHSPTSCLDWRGRIWCFWMNHPTGCDNTARLVTTEAAREDWGLFVLPPRKNPRPRRPR